MDLSAVGVTPPTVAQRVAAREPPPGAPVMFQQWRDLLFLHWAYPADLIQATLPLGLTVDTHEGVAYLGVVPFAMHGVRPRFLPTVPGISSFLELNLRTYVHDRHGIPGVWFYSLDANQWLAVEIARRLFSLPYQHARMALHRTRDGGIRFRSERRGAAPADARVADFAWSVGEREALAAPGSLAYFLVERYRLYAQGPRGLMRGAVAHAPYPLHRALVKAGDDALLSLNGFARTARAPDHVTCSPGVDVRIHALERVSER